jgi:hypothetical protein
LYEWTKEGDGPDEWRVRQTKVTLADINIPADNDGHSDDERTEQQTAARKIYVMKQVQAT